MIELKPENSVDDRASIDPLSPLNSAPAKSYRDRAKSLYRARRLRDRYFHGRFLGEPAWDLLLDLFAANEAGADVSISSACIAAAAPNTTALRYVNLLVEQRLLERIPHGSDGRSELVRITPVGHKAMADYLDSISKI